MRMPQCGVQGGQKKYIRIETEWDLQIELLCFAPSFLESCPPWNPDLRCQKVASVPIVARVFVLFLFYVTYAGSVLVRRFDNILYTTIQEAVEVGFDLPNKQRGNMWDNE